MASCNKNSNVCDSGDPEKRRAGWKERKAGGLAKHLPIQEAEWIPNRLNPEKATWRHIRVKLLKTEDKKEKEKDSSKREMRLCPRGRSN